MIKGRKPLWRTIWGLFQWNWE